MRRDNRRAVAIARQILDHALSSVEPSAAVRAFTALKGDSLVIGDTTHDLASVDRILLVGAGKASTLMAAALEGLLGKRIADGLIITKHGHVPPHTQPRLVDVIEASHPIPCERGVSASGRLLEMTTGCTRKDLLLCAWSGGGSSLLTLPAPGLALGDLQAVVQLLLNSGATIQQLNTVRKHLSSVKGGLLARAASPAKVSSLIISDVVGDALDTIASGPTAPDSSSFKDALEILNRRGIADRAPEGILTHLHRGASGEIDETPDQANWPREAITNTIIASNTICTGAARDKAVALGLDTALVNGALEGEAREIGHQVGAAVRAIEDRVGPVGRPGCLVFGGETTVSVKGRGTGGRNQELALAASTHLAGMERICLAAFATDGQDGPTTAAGAVVTGETVHRATEAGMDPAVFLDNNDSNTFFDRLDDLIVTGPTYTNVADLIVVVLL